MHWKHHREEQTQDTEDNVACNYETFFSGIFFSHVGRTFQVNRTLAASTVTAVPRLTQTAVRSQGVYTLSIFITMSSLVTTFILV